MKQTATTKTTYHIPIGPIHPALKEPVYFEFEIEGVTIPEVIQQILQEVTVPR